MQPSDLNPLAAMSQWQKEQGLRKGGVVDVRRPRYCHAVAVMGRLSQNFPEPERFLPERWSRENKDTLPNMFASLPFGFGTRMCVGERWESGTCQ